MKYYKAEDVIRFLNMNCPKDMWEYQIADLPTIEVSEDAISNGAISYDYIKGYREAVQKLEKFYLGEAKARNEKDRGMTREEAIMHLDFLKDYKTPQQIEAINLAIKALSATTEQSSKVGEWINDTRYSGWTCTNCNYHDGNAVDNYCPNCGAKMKGAEE